jgi:AAA family ATP:ADP antiporter
VDSTNTVEGDIKFGKWRQRLWPVHAHESKKFFPLLLMKCCISFIYTVLFATKDTLIVTAKGSGAETIPILKGWFVLFFACIFMIVYSKLSNHLSRSRLFYATLLPFICFFAIYGFFLYPNRDWLLPHQTADRLIALVGPERAHWVAVYRYWMDSIFFLMAELWGGVVIALSFWGLANRINSLNEASRFYSLLSAGGHIGVIIAGPLIWHFSHAVDHFTFTIQCLMGIVSGVGFLVILIYWWINRNVIEGKEQSSQKIINAPTKLSLIDSLKHLMRSPSLNYIALMVIGYSLSVNMIEVVWKAALKLRYPNPQDYEAFMGLLTSITGCVSLVIALFVGGNVIRKFGWFVAAQATPVVLGLLSLLFLGVYFSNDIWNTSTVFMGLAALSLLVLIGAIHNVSCKSMKYCLFDPTREMAYIPLDEETKVKGKAAVDVVASRFGKSGSSWIQVLFMEIVGTGSIFGVVPYLAPFIVLAVVGWVIAICYLQRQINQKPEVSPENA